MTKRVTVAHPDFKAAFRGMKSRGLSKVYLSTCGLMFVRFTPWRFEPIDLNFVVEVADVKTTLGFFISPCARM